MDSPLSSHGTRLRSGGIFSLHDSFFSLTACAGIFFSAEPLCTNFFSDKYCFFLNSEILIHYLCFVLYKLFYTHNRSKDTGHVDAKSFRKCTHSERGGSHLEWTASLSFFSVPALSNSSPTAHHKDAILHSPEQPLCSAFHSKMSIQKEGTCLVKVKY